MSFSAAAGKIAPPSFTPTPPGWPTAISSCPWMTAPSPPTMPRPPAGRTCPSCWWCRRSWRARAHQDLCRRLAHAGYLAVAANLYERQGDASAYTDIPKLVAELVSKVSDEQVYADLDASLAWAARNGGDPARVAVTGFCWGGRLTWMYAAHNPAVKAGVAWYGKLSVGHGPLIKRYALDVAQDLRAPVLGLYGGRDASIPLADVDRMKASLAAGSVAARRSEIVVYPEADHGFLADYRPNYNAQAAQDGWRRMLDWFQNHL